MSGNLKSTGAAQALPAAGGFGMPLNVRMGILASLVGLAILLLATAVNGEMGQFWAFGLAFGFVLQRSRFCFASAFRDIFLLRHSRSLQAVIVGLLVATIGFGVLMARQVPNTNLPVLPPSANILPIGLHTILGGLLFGTGMVVAGGCVSGSIYRMGEGYVASWVSLGGIMVGLLGASYTWNWWWENHISGGAQIWLPHYFGHGGAIALTIVGLILVYLLALWWESRGGIVLPEAPFRANEDETFRAKVNDVWRRVFVHGWPILIGGAVLGFLNVAMFVASHPWGFTGEVSRWVIGATNFVGIGPGELAGASSLPGCALDMGDTGILHHMLFLVWGMVFGSFIAALFSGEFKIRVPKNKTRYFQSVGGGVVMGYGAGLAMGCTIGAFFSSIPSLGLNGWVFALFLAIGAWIGTQIIQRIE